MSFQQRKVLQALERFGCRFLREGGSHIIYASPTGGIVKVPRHKQIKRGTARSIAKEAGIDPAAFARAAS